MTVSFGPSFLKGLFVLLVDIRVKIWQHTYDSVWIYGKCRQRFYQTFTNFILNFFHVFTFFYTFLYFLSERLLHLRCEWQ